MYLLIPGTFKYAMLHGKGELRWQMELRLLIYLTLKWGDDPELSKLAHSNHKGPQGGRQNRSE